MNTPDEPALERYLRESRPGPIADEGFSANVLAALPPPTRRRSALPTRPLAAALGATAGVIVVLVRGVRFDQLESTLRQFAELSMDPWVRVAILTALATIAVIYAPSFRRKGL